MITLRRPTQIKAFERDEVLAAIREDAGAGAIITWLGVLEITGTAQQVKDAVQLVRDWTTWTLTFCDYGTSRPNKATFNVLT